MDHEHDNDLHADPRLDTPPGTSEQAGGRARTDNPVCYHQNCPVCGRNLRIRVMLLGQRVYCQHCGGGFIATDACDDAGHPHASDDRPRSATVDELIERAAVMLALTPGQDVPGQDMQALDLMGPGAG